MKRAQELLVDEVCAKIKRKSLVNTTAHFLLAANSRTDDFFLILEHCKMFATNACDTWNTSGHFFFLINFLHSIHATICKGNVSCTSFSRTFDDTPMATANRVHPHAQFEQP